MDKSRQPVFSKSTFTQNPCVLFMDYNGWWAPLNYLYYSSSSKILVSRHPESSIEEILSHYCPQCLNKFVEDDVHSYRNRCPSCFICPVCASPLSGVALTVDTCCFQCGMCCWRSDSAALVGSDTQDLESAVLERERSSSAQEAFQTILAGYQAHESVFANPPIGDLTSGRSSCTPSWTWSDTEQARHLKNTAAVIDPRAQSSLYKYAQASNIFNESDNDVASVAQVTDHSKLTSLSQRLVSQRSGSMAAHCSALLPARVHLRTKRMLRCRKDVNDGKMSILIQPKMYPLEGDSSNKLHQGKWWTKDSSAVHSVPSVSVARLPTLSAAVMSMETDPRRIVFLHLTLTNYKETDVSVGLEVIGDATECIDVNHDGGRECHPPFLHPADPLQPVHCSPDGSTRGIFLAGYEDELLRDEQDTVDCGALAPEHACGDWGVLLCSNAAKVSIPLLLQPRSDNSTTHRELVLAMSCEDTSAGSPQDGGNTVPLNKERAVRVFMRIVFPDIV